MQNGCLLVAGPFKKSVGGYNYSIAICSNLADGCGTDTNVAVCQHVVESDKNFTLGRLNSKKLTYGYLHFHVSFKLTSDGDFLLDMPTAR